MSFKTPARTTPDTFIKQTTAQVQVDIPATFDRRMRHIRPSIVPRIVILSAVVYADNRFRV